MLSRCLSLLFLSAAALPAAAAPEVWTDRPAQTLLTLPQALDVCLLLIGGVLLALGAANRRDRHLARFGALALAWALLDAPLWLDPSIDGRWLLPSIAQPLVALTAVRFFLHHAGSRNAWIDAGLMAQLFLVPISLLVLWGLRAAAPSQTLAVWTAPLTLEVAVAALFCLRAERYRRPASFRVMAALLALVALAGVAGWTAPWLDLPPWAGALAHLATPLALALAGLLLLRQGGSASAPSEETRAQVDQRVEQRVEQRVREAAVEIERNFRQLSELKIERVTERERKRIAADLHDDLGAKLLTIVHTSENDRISTLAREALEEMRLSVRGLTGKAVQLSDALGDWRIEVVSRLAQAGIETEWSAPEDLPQRLSARAYVQTTRILREATSNIIRHSGATYCHVRALVADGDFQFVVQDNGKGIASERDGRLDRGHGMATMKQRAKQLHGQCLVESVLGFGTVIRLTLPLDSALEGA
jgi:signal transduction histidine kinase